MTNRNSYITAERPDRFWFNHYINSAQRFRTLARNAGADVVLSNHTNFDGSKTKLPAMADAPRRRSASLRGRSRFGGALPDRGGRVRQGRPVAGEVTSCPRARPKRRKFAQLLVGKISPET